MDYKELEDLGYSPLEIKELNELGIAELVVSAHSELKNPAQKEETGAPAWATACVAVFSVLLLSAPWAGVIVEAQRKSVLRDAFQNEELDKQPTGWTCGPIRNSCMIDDLYESYK